jgi:putative membrane protein
MHTYIRNALPVTLLLAGLSTMAVAASPPMKTIPAAANPTFANPDTPGLMAGKPADAANVTDVVFLKQLAIGSQAEVELGKLAGERGSADQIDGYGQRMAKDHDSANSKLASLARGAKVELPKELDAEHIAARKELQSLSGKAFDLRYIEGQIKDHQKTVQLLVHEIGSGQHTAVRQFAADTLPAVMEHLQLAKDVHAQLTGAAPPKSPDSP